MMTLREKLDDYDLMPLGVRETLPVSVTKDTIPPFKELGPVDRVWDIYQEFIELELDDAYISSRLDVFNQYQIDIDEYKTYMAALGFSKTTYGVYALRDCDGKWLMPKDSVTHQTLLNWPTDIFRPQFNYVKSDWHTNQHHDHLNSSIHGFRVLIPLNDVSHIMIDDVHHVLNPGYAYFIDVTRPHAAWARAGRTALSFQMTDDTLL